MSSPFDLHALAVLAVLTFLKNDSTKRLGTLSNRVKELENLARREPALPSGKAASLEARIWSVLQKNKELAALLGPHNLVSAGSGITAEQAYGVVPPELWCDLLATIVRMYPALGPDSTCQDYGSTDMAALERVFDQSVSSLAELLVSTRTLLLGEQQMNREIVGVLNQKLATLK
jgi:hypothetical protein